MKLINYGEAAWQLGDEAAELLMEYSVLMARVNIADSINVTMLDAEGVAQNLNMLIGPATMMTSRATETAFPEPENAETIAQIRAKIEAIESPPSVLPADPVEAQSGIGDYDL